MADIIDFVIPEFLKGHSAKEIQGRIMANITDRLDKSEGSLLWDITYPSALVIAETVEYVCVELLRNLFPMWAEGNMLDYHGANRGLPRKIATKATGKVVFEGPVGTHIPVGTKVATSAVMANEVVVLFETTEEATIVGAGVALPVQAVSAGSDGNVAARRIDRMDSVIPSITAVYNVLPTEGGTDNEKDDEYRQRLVDYDEAQGVSYVGSVADYKRWAMSVAGVGDVKVVTSDDGSGLVTLVLTDPDGNPVSSDVRNDVYNYIMSPYDPDARLAPVNTQLEVTSPETIKVTISANVYVDRFVDEDELKKQFVAVLNEYYKDQAKDWVYYNKVGGILATLDYVVDYDSLLINGSADNVNLGEPDKLPITTVDDIDLMVTLALTTG